MESLEVCGVLPSALTRKLTRAVETTQCSLIHFLCAESAVVLSDHFGREEGEYNVDTHEADVHPCLVKGTDVRLTLSHID